MKEISENFTRSDRDLLIRLDTKVDALTDNMKSLSDGMTIRLAKAEARLDQMDIFHAKIDLAYYADVAKWASSVRANLKVLGSLFVFFNAAITSIIILLIKHFFGL